MQLPAALANLLQEPPPEYAFEVSPAGLAYARPSSGPDVGFVPLPPGTLAISPLRDNVVAPDDLADAVRRAAGTVDPRRRKRAALILPDYCARVAVLDFDSFPAKPEDQAALVRFRMKKSVPFDVESAVVGYHVQGGQGKKMDVVVAVVSLDIVARYEAAFRAANFHPGLVTTSTLAAMPLLKQPDIVVWAKLSENTLTVTVVQDDRLKLIRCVELPETTVDEVLAVLYPTLAYIEDELNTRPQRLLLSGFGDEWTGNAVQWEAELGIPVEPVRSRRGAPDAHNTGLYGYLESVQ